MATYYRVNLKDKKNNIVYPNIHNNITIDNDSGMMHLERKLGDTMFLCKRIDTGTEVRFGVGSGGTNHGIWSGPLAKWMVYADSTNVYLNGIAQKATSDKNGLQIDTSYLKLSGGNMTGDIQFNSKGLYWKEGTYGDQFKIIPNFSGIDDSNKLQIQGAVGEKNTTPALYNLVTISGKSGNVWIKGNISINNGGVITKLMKTATTDTAPNHNQANLKLKAHTNAKYMPALSFEETGSSDGTLYMRNRALYWGSTIAISGEVPEANKGYKILHTGNFSNTTLSKLTSSLITNTHIAGNQGTAIINSTAAGNGYTMLAKMNSTNGKFTLGSWNTTFRLFYTTNTIVNAGTNSYTYAVTLLDENGNANFPKQVQTGGRVYIAFGGTANANAVPKFSESCLRISTPNATKYNPSIGFEESGSSNGTLCMRGRALYWSSTSAASGEVPAANTKYKLWHAGNFAGGVKGLSSKSHSNWGKNNGYVPNMSFITFWNGAYASNNASNLTYAHQGTIQCKPTSLYDNSTGTTGTVTLSQSAANFTYLTIFTRDDDNHYSSRDVYRPNGKSVYFISGYPQNNSSQGFCNIKMSISYINGTTISRTKSTFLNTTGGETTIQAVTKHYIVKVIGYK